jgi:hypothetical protein
MRPNQINLTADDTRLREAMVERAPGYAARDVMSSLLIHGARIEAPDPPPQRAVGIGYAGRGV